MNIIVIIRDNCFLHTIRWNCLRKSFISTISHFLELMLLQRFLHHRNFYSSFFNAFSFGFNRMFQSLILWQICHLHRLNCVSPINYGIDTFPIDSNWILFTYMETSWKIIRLFLSSMIVYDQSMFLGVLFFKPLIVYRILLIWLFDNFGLIHSLLLF